VCTFHPRHSIGGDELSQPAHTHHIRHYKRSQFEATIYISPETLKTLESDDFKAVEKAHRTICGAFNYECRKKYGGKWTQHFSYVTWRQLVITPLNQKEGKMDQADTPTQPAASPTECPCPESCVMCDNGDHGRCNKCPRTV